MRPWLPLSALALAVLAGGCASSPDVWLLARYAKNNSVSAFRICKNYGCAMSMTVSLTDAEWSRVRAFFSSPSGSAAEEREQVRHAIALLETMVGPKAGTANDEAGAPIFNVSRDGQLDCIDE